MRSRDLFGGVLMSRSHASEPVQRFGVLATLVDRAAFKLPFWAVTAAPVVTIACRIWLR